MYQSIKSRLRFLIIFNFICFKNNKSTHIVPVQGSCSKSFILMEKDLKKVNLKKLLDLKIQLNFCKFYKFGYLIHFWSSRNDWVRSNLFEKTTWKKYFLKNKPVYKKKKFVSLQIRLQIGFISTNICTFVTNNILRALYWGFTYIWLHPFINI